MARDLTECRLNVSFFIKFINKKPEKKTGRRRNVTMLIIHNLTTVVKFDENFNIEIV